MTDHIVSVDDNYNFPAPVINALGKKLANANTGSMIRIDKTIGTRVFVNDGVKEHMISGDTGWRSVILADSTNVMSGEIRWKRVNEKVYLRFINVIMKTGNGYTQLPISPPYGFRQVTNDRIMQSIGMTANATGLQTISIFTGTIAWLYQIAGGVVNTVRPTTDGLQGTLSWNTDDPWPTSLPGTAL